MSLGTQPSSQPAQIQRQTLQSTMSPDGPEGELSPVHSEIHNEPRNTYYGRSPIKLHFPKLGRMENTQDSLMFLDKCKDFLALHPLTDTELTATICNVLQ